MFYNCSIRFGVIDDDILKYLDYFIKNFKIKIAKILDIRNHILYNSNVIALSAINYLIYGELAEWSKAAVLKTVEVRASWGSNP